MLAPYEELNRMFTGEAFPALDISAKESEIRITAEVPGFSASGIEIRIEDDTLTLRGTREESKAEEAMTVLLRERFRGSFSRSLALPYRIDTAKVEARLKDGVLSLLLPRAEADLPKKIEVKIE